MAIINDMIKERYTESYDQAFFINSHVFIPVSGIIYNPIERAYPTLQTLQTNASLPPQGIWMHIGWGNLRYFIVLCFGGTS